MESVWRKGLFLILMGKKRNHSEIDICIFSRKNQKTKGTFLFKKKSTKGTFFFKGLFFYYTPPRRSSVFDFFKKKVGYSFERVWRFAHFPYTRKFSAISKQRQAAPQIGFKTLLLGGYTVVGTRSVSLETKKIAEQAQ